MDSVELLMKFSDPELIKSLTTSEKLTAGLITTVLGMGITFVALVVLQFVTAFMEKLAVTKEEVPAAPVNEPAQAASQDTSDDQAQNEELIAVLSAAVAMQMQTSVSNIVIKNIERIEDNSPAWNKAGIMEQLNNSV